MRIYIEPSNLITDLVEGDARTFAQRAVRLGLGYELFGILTPVIEAIYLPGTDSYRYGFNLLYVPWSAEEGRLALGGGYDLENKRWGAMFVLRMGFVELVYSSYDMDLVGLCHSIRLAFSPEF